MKKILRISVLTLLFFTPLLFTTNTREVFEFPKMFFVYTMSLVLVTLFLVDLVLRPRKPKGFPLVLMVYLGAFVFATLLSSHLYTSIWGYYTRFNGGLLSVLSYFGIYFVIVNTFTLSERKGLLKLFLLTLVPISIYGILQHFGITFLNWKADPQVRAFSTFGQPNWLAQYLAMLLLLVLHFSLKEKKFFWSTVYLLGFACLWFSYSMSGILGFVFSLFLFVFLQYKRSLLNKKTFIHLVVLGVLSFSIALSQPGIFGARLHDVMLESRRLFGLVQKVYALDKGIDSYVISDPGFIRTTLWSGTLDLIKSSPKVFIMGSGPGTFPYAFQKFRPLDLNYSSEWNYVFNKPHNYYLELWAELGLLGLGSFLVLVLWFMFKAAQSGSYYLLPGICAFLVTNIFGWPVVGTMLVWYLWLSLAAD